MGLKSVRFNILKLKIMKRNDNIVWLSRDHHSGFFAAGR
jgi:hypothetical protein